MLLHCVLQFILLLRFKSVYEDQKIKIMFETKYKQVLLAQ